MNSAAPFRPRIARQVSPRTHLRTAAAATNGQTGRALYDDGNARQPHLPQSCRLIRRRATGMVASAPRRAPRPRPANRRPSQPSICANETAVAAFRTSKVVSWRAKSRTCVRLIEIAARRAFAYLDAEGKLLRRLFNQAVEDRCGKDRNSQSDDGDRRNHYGAE